MITDRPSAKGGNMRLQVFTGALLSGAYAQ